ncbi:MAG: Ig-like domain-containing protein [Anaerolineae bacterium]
MSDQPRKIRFLVALLPALGLVAFALTALLWPRMNLALPVIRSSSPASALARAWQRAQEAGTYRLTSDVRQTLTPRALPANVGRGDSHAALRFEGEASLPDRARLTIVVGGANSSPGEAAAPAAVGLTGTGTGTVQLVMVGDRAYVGHAGQWRVVENPLGGAAPVADALSLLSVARDVEAVDVGSAFSSYRFTIDGARYAEIQRERLQALAQRELPPGVEVQAPAVYQRMSGTGQVWIDSAGLPRRVVVDLSLPGISASSDAQVHAQVDYRDFGASIAPIEAPAGVDAAGQAASTPGVLAWVPGVRLPSIPMPFDPTLFAVGTVALILGLAARKLQRRRHALYAVIVVTVISSMIATPLVQASQVVRFQERAQSQETLPDALSALGVTESPREPDRVAALAAEFTSPRSSPQPASANPASLTTAVSDCGSLPDGVDPNGDDDGDGLSNKTERCLGTDYRLADTDGDGITDTLELQGFPVATNGVTQTWTTDPLQRDSNHDGIDDGQEWNPKWLASDPASLDADGDGIPNAWDDDNDNDGVPNGPDLSAYKALPYRPAYQIGISKPSDTSHKDTYVYLDVQVQPQDVSHLRYTTTYLDWPYDNQAQIQDLDNSTDDIKLIPMLSLSSTVSLSLASQYGVTVKSNPDGSFSYLVPLSTVESNGAISAFEGRLAFTPAESATPLQLSNVRLGWLVQAKLDQQKCLAYGGTTCTNWGVDTTESVVNSYEEPSFRITGMTVGESADAQVALFGVPSAPEVSASAPDEAREIFNLVSGMGMSYLAALQPDLSTVVKRFTDSTTPVTETWGVSAPVKAVYNTYAHRDEALASTTMTTTQAFLGANYNAALTPTLVVAYQETAGSLSIEAGPNQGVTIQDSPDSLSLDMALSYNALTTVRQVQVQMYQHSQAAAGQPAWRALTMNQALGELDRRYQAFDAEKSAERYIKALFLTWYAGLVKFVDVNGKPLVQDQADDTTIFNQLSRPAQNNLPGYVVASYALDELADDVNQQGATAGFQQWQATTWGQSAALREGAVPIVRAFGGVATMALPYLRLIPQGIRWAARAAASNITEAAEVASETTSAGEEAAETVASSAKALGRIAVVIAVVATVIELATIWSSFHGYSDDVSHMQTDVELSSDIAATIITVLQLLLALVLVAVADTGVGLLVEVVLAVLLYLIVALITGDWNPLHTYNYLTSWLSDFLVKFAFYSQLPSSNAVESGPLTLTLGDQNQGTVVSNSVTFGAALTTTVEVGPGDDEWNWVYSRAGNSDDVAQSWAYTRWSSSDSQITYGQGDCAMDGTSKKCGSAVTASFTPAQAALNAAIHVTSFVSFSLRYQKCWWAVLVRVCEADSTVDSSPKSDDADAWAQATQPLTIDVLPRTVDGLWSWDQITNPDKDGDGIPDTQEAALGLDPTKWDTDGDGLSDGWELQNQATLGTDPTKADTDGDGLNDRLEVILGTSAGVADSDKDGLLDGEEVCHVDTSGAAPRLAGGWLVSPPGSPAGASYRVCSNPLDPDADSDELQDGQERAFGLSPFGANTAPRMSASIQQPLTQHAGTTLSLLKPGGALAAQFLLADQIATTLDKPLQLCFPSSDFGTPTVTAAQPSAGYTPPSPATQTSGGQTCSAWDLSQKPLYSGEALTVTWQSAALSGGGSRNTALSLSLPYTDPTDGSTKAVSRTLPVIIDAVPPTTSIGAPSAGAAIKGTSYVVGGQAKDDITWVSQVQVSVDGLVPWQTASGAESWAWTWSPLPKDGPYTVRVHALDAVGNQSPDATAAVVIDNTAPGASFNGLTDGQVINGLVKNTLGGASVSLQGSATDLLSGASAVSGVKAVELSIDGRPWQTVLEKRAPYPQTAAWSWTWKLDAKASGKHTLSVRAVDGLGQIGQPQTRAVVVDLVPPAVNVANSVTDAQTGRPINLLGHADDTGYVPLPARPTPLEGAVDSVLSATIQLAPEVEGDLTGATAVWLGDVNGDGLADAAVGLPAARNGAGRVAILNGRPGGWPVPPAMLSLADAESSLAASQASSFGQYLAPAGDVNGDGLADLLIGDPTNGVVYVVFGQTGPLGKDWDVAQLKEPTQSSRGVVFTTSAGGDSIGAFMAAAGDVNGDGVGDLLIGADNAAHQGHLYLLQGRRRWPSQVRDVTADASAALPINLIGAGFSGVGDVNGDQMADFAVADPNNSLGGGAAVYLFLGSPAFQTPRIGGSPQPLDRGRAAASLPGDAPLGAQVVPLGDVNRDGLADFIYSSGAAPRLILGRTSGAWTPSVTFNGYTPAPSGFIAAGGDVNADGYNDIVLGTASNTAYVIHGAASLPATPNIAATLTSVGRVASAPFSAGADLNCDLSSDLLILPSTVTAKASGPNFGRAPHIPEAALPVGAAPGAIRDTSPARKAAAASPVTAQPPFQGAWFVPTSHNLSDFTAGSNYHYVVPEDLDGDGLADLWLGLNGAWDARLSRGRQADGSIAFQKVAVGLPAPDAYGLFGYVRGDFNGDGKLDAARAVDGNYDVYLGGGLVNNTLTFNHVDTNLPGGYAQRQYSLAGDFDGDKKAEIASYIGNWVFFVPQGVVNGQLQFSQVNSNLGTFGNGIADNIGMADFNGDGKLDLVYYDGNTQSWDFRLSQGLVNGVMTFSATTGDAGDMHMTAGEFAQFAAIPDYNGDGRADLAVFDLDASTWDIRLSMPTADGLHFERIPANIDDNYGLYWLVLGAQGDFDGDGRADLVRWVNAANNWEARLSSHPQYLYVDDDYVAGQANDGHTWGVDAFQDIGSAVQVAQPGSEIHVATGVYPPFEIGQIKDGISVVGIDPDAVFVQGTPEISIHDSVGVRLSGLTRRTDGIGVRLKYAGLAESRRFGSTTVLDRVVLQGADHNVVMDPYSALTVRQSTLVGALASHEQVFVEPGPPPPTWVSAWETVPTPPTAITGTIATLGGCVYAMPKVNPPFNLYCYDTVTNSWDQPTAMPDDGRVALTYGAVSVGDRDLYVSSVGISHLCTQGCDPIPAFYHWYAPADLWEPLPITPFIPPRSLASDGAHFLFTVSPRDSRIYYFELSERAWYIYSPPLPQSVGPGATITWANGILYLTPDSNSSVWYAYDGQANTFQQLPSPPNPFIGGPTTVWDGEDTIYALGTPPANGSSLMAYSISAKAWTTVPYTQLFGQPNSLVRQGGYLYVTSQGAPLSFSFMRYGPLNIYPRQLTLDHVAFVAPAAASTPAWLNLPLGFGDFDTTGSQWVGGGTWSPAPPQPSITFDAARFVDPVHGVYRVGAGSALTAGYHTYRAAAHVSPTYCATCGNDGHTWGQDAFAGIQAAIGSGAEQVLLGPGVYPEPFSLVSGVQVIGSGADATIVTGNPISPTAIVQADGISGARLTRLTVAGSGGSIGVHLKNNARAVSITRDVIRQTQEAIRVEGGDPADPLLVVNNTLVNNTNGVSNPSCGAVEVRNTVFAFNPGTALNLQTCATTRLHTYNLFWRNGHDLAMDGSVVDQPGPGEVFADPRLEDVSRQDYRPQVGSPAVDAGDPYDPTPPGSGGRVDIGYVQTGQASFYADGSYCAACINDGLEWSVDAFNTVQAAVNAANQFQRALGVTCQGGGQCRQPLTVGVGPGTYTETVSLPSYVRLIGSGADKTVIEGSGVGQSAVHIANALHVEVSGLTITASPGGGTGTAGLEIISGTNFITVTRNLIRNNGVGVRLQDSTGLLLNNTIVGNASDGVAAANNTTWFSVRDNIVADNAGNGFSEASGGQLLGDYNLVFGNKADYAGLAPGPHDQVDKDPAFVNPIAQDYRLQHGSPAVDAGDPPAPVPVGGGKRVDIGYSERLAVPLTLLLGKEGATCAAGAAGIASVEVGLARVADATQPVTATLPITWTAASVSSGGQVGSYWSAAVTPSTGDGLYRLYARGVDAAGNGVSDPRLWFQNEIVADGSPPQVTWLAPSDGLVTAAAAITVEARVADDADTGRGMRDNVDSVSVLIDGIPVAADPADGPAAADSGQGRVYRAVVPLSDGQHQVVVVARDRAGNETRSPARTVTATTLTDVATITSPLDGAAGSPGTWTVEGFARFTSATGPGTVTLYADGKPVSTATLASPLGALTKWTAVFGAPIEGAHSLAAVAQRKTPGTLASAATSRLTLSAQPPSLTITSPSTSSGAVVTQTLALGGTAKPGAGGVPLASVALSLDGGVNWYPASATGLNNPVGATWSITWTPPLKSDSRYYFGQVRATDAAGHTATQQIHVLADNWGPSGFATQFSPDVGQHLTAPAQVQVRWTPPTDGSGRVSMLASADQVADSMPTQVVSGSPATTSTTATFSSAGTWYIHLAAQDAYGNLTLRHYGPWYVGAGS